MELDSIHAKATHYRLIIIIVSSVFFITKYFLFALILLNSFHRSIAFFVSKHFAAILLFKH